MKSLKPSHREKKRYMLIEGRDASKEIIEKTILDYIGILGFAKACPQIVKRSKNKLILAVNRSEISKVRASFLLSGKRLQIKKISGSLKKLK